MIRGVTILAIVLFASPVAAASEAGAVFQSMASVLDMAYEIERYALRHGRLPAAQSPAELSQALLGTDSMTEVLVDAWGTPLHIDSNPDTKRYVVASAGADKRFDRAQWTARAATNDAAADIVIRDGEMLRWPEEWALARFCAEDGDALTAEPAGRDALYATGVAFYEVVAQSGDAIPADRRRTFAAHARRMLERAAALDENAMEPLVYLSLVVRQQAMFESDSTKAAKLVEEADAIRGRAIEISKRRRAGQ
jgi:hypothetical protein